MVLDSPIGTSSTLKPRLKLEHGSHGFWVVVVDFFVVDEDELELLEDDWYVFLHTPSLC